MPEYHAQHGDIYESDDVLVYDGKGEYEVTKYWERGNHGQKDFKYDSGWLIATNVTHWCYITRPKD